MRMFLIAMTDIFLILFLTTIVKTPATSVLTVEDFFQLKTMHETLQAKQKETEEKLVQQIRLTRQEKDALAAKLAEEQKRAEEMKKSLIVSDMELKQISEDLRAKEDMLKDREQLLASLNQKIADKQALWKKTETSYKEKLEDQKESLEANRMRAEKLQVEAQKAQKLANQMQQEADQAHEIARQAKAVKENAIFLKDKALKEKQKAQKKAQEALEARQKAEEEARRAREIKEQVEQKAEKLAETIKDITQEGDTAYQSNIFPQIQQVTVTFKRIIKDISGVKDVVASYSRGLALVPVKIGGQVFGIFPSGQVGFARGSDEAPLKLAITYKGKRIPRYWINKEDNLIAVELPGFTAKALDPYSADAKTAQLMPTLLAVRNKGGKGLGDLIRGLSDEYFIVNRDYIHTSDEGGLEYQLKGLRGTGMRGERIIRGDQLVDLNGRLVGVANDANHIVRIDNIKGWEEKALK